MLSSVGCQHSCHCVSGRILFAALITVYVDTKRWVQVEPLGPRRSLGKRKAGKEEQSMSRIWAARGQPVGGHTGQGRCSREQNAMFCVALVELTADRVGSESGCATPGILSCGDPAPTLQKQRCR